jgi:hypothetical protein
MISFGRVAVGHHWTPAERAWLADDVEGWRRVRSSTRCRTIGRPSKRIEQRR